MERGFSTGVHSLTVNIWHTAHIRDVGRSENLGVGVSYGGHNLPPFVEIGLTDLPKFVGAMAPPAPPGTTGLHLSTGTDLEIENTLWLLGVK